MTAQVIGSGSAKVLLNGGLVVAVGTKWHVISQHKSFLIFHAAGAGDTVIVQGSNDPRVESDPTNAIWVTLRDTGNATAADVLISLASGAGAVSAGFSNNEPWKWVRANKTAAAAGVASSVILGT